MTIDWCELVIFYNDVFGTKFKSEAAMRKSCLKRFGTIYEAADKLGISPESLRAKLKADGAKILLPGKWPRKKKRT